MGAGGAGGTVTVTYPTFVSVSLPPPLAARSETVNVQMSPGTPVQSYVTVCGPWLRDVASLTLPLPVPPGPLNVHNQLVGPFVD